MSHFRHLMMSLIRISLQANNYAIMGRYLLSYSLKFLWNWRVRGWNLEDVFTRFASLLNRLSKKRTQTITDTVFMRFSQADIIQVKYNIIRSRRKIVLWQDRIMIKVNIFLQSWENMSIAVLYSSVAMKSGGTNWIPWNFSHAFSWYHNKSFIGSTTSIFWNWRFKTTRHNLALELKNLATASMHSSEVHLSLSAAVSASLAAWRADFVQRRIRLLHTDTDWEKNTSCFVSGVTIKGWQRQTLAGIPASIASSMSTLVSNSWLEKTAVTSPEVTASGAERDRPMQNISRDLPVPSSLGNMNWAQFWRFYAKILWNRCFLCISNSKINESHCTWLLITD